MVHTPLLDDAHQRDLLAISTHLSAMADLAERMVRDAVTAVLTRDHVLAARVMRDDLRLDAMEVECDRLCVHLLARRAPVGGDLRLVTAALKTVTDLERIGDLAVNLVKRGLPDHGEHGLPTEVVELARSVVAQLGLAIRALRERDARLARTLRTEDLSTDACNRAAFRQLIERANSGRANVEQALALTNLCRHLERIGDHAVNVAEMVVYVVDGSVVRHRADG